MACDGADWSPDVAPTLRAAEYVRMSTEHQQYSTLNQIARIREYAQHRGISIVRTYADEGKSGLTLEGRVALQQMLKDVQGKQVDFSVILVYDVSRWGRFQDADESAYYEYICRREGIQVAYCAEQFENDGSPISTIVKGVKRAMAGEYSRELSSKVFAGQCRLIELGFRQGGTAGYGLRRVLVSQDGRIKGELTFGEHKSLQTDRVILVPGPDAEVRQVREIYRWFVTEGASEVAIARRLNAAGVQTGSGHEWTRGTVHHILTSEKYMGSNIYNKRSFKLKKLRVRNAKPMWIRKEDAFEAIVPREVFAQAQQIILARARRYNDEEMLAALRRLKEQKGYLSASLVLASDGLPSPTSYARRFGSLCKAFALVGFTPSLDLGYLQTRQLVQSLQPQVAAESERRIADLGGMVYRSATSRQLDINHDFSVSITVVPCHRSAQGTCRWKIKHDDGATADLLVAIRLDSHNQKAMDCYLLPRRIFETPEITIGEHNTVEVESFRFENLDFLYAMAAQVQLTEAA